VKDGTEDPLQYVQRMLKDCSTKVIAENTGLSYLTVWKIKNGKSTSPSFTTVNKLAEYFRERNK
jgi:transcriptional regulator with XRE-family HTH domain